MTLKNIYDIKIPNISFEKKNSTKEKLANFLIIRKFYVEIKS